MIPSASPAQPYDVELTTVREAIFEILGVNWEAFTDVWQERSRIVCTFFPAGSNEEIRIALMPKFPWTASEESDSEQRTPPGPPLVGHPAIHESAAPEILRGQDGRRS